MDKITNAINEAAGKFGYDDELVDVLKRVTSVMTEGKSEDEVQMLANTLLRTKIFIIDHDATQEDYDRCEKEIIGDLNSHVEFAEDEHGVYGKDVAPGAYVSEPIFDEGMNIVDRKSFLYVSRISSNSELAKEYGTTINLSHFIHELGHGWAAEKGEYVQLENGEYTTNVGAFSERSIVDRENHRVIQDKYTGLLIEEALNTIQEEEVLCKLLGIESVKELSSKGYVSSNYQGLISDMMKAYIEKFGKEEFDKYRILKDRNALEDIEEVLAKTEAWDNIQSGITNRAKKEEVDKIDTLPFSDGAKSKIKGLFEEYQEVYYPDNSKFTPIEKLENIFTQLYDFKEIKYSFDLSNPEILKSYQSLMMSILREGYVPLNQAPEINKDIQKASEEVEPEKPSFKEGLKTSVYPPEEIETTNSVSPEDVSEIKKQGPVAHEDI